MKEFRKSMEITGTLSHFGETFECKLQKSPSGWEGYVTSLFLTQEVNGQKNRIKIKLMGGETKKQQKEGFNYFEDGESNTVAYKDKNNQETLKGLPYSAVKTIKVPGENGETKEDLFISDKDFIEAFANLYKNGAFTGKKVYVYGKITPNRYKGKNNFELEPSKIEVVADDFKDINKSRMQLFFTGSPLGDDIYKGNHLDIGFIKELAGEDNRLIIPAYVITDNSDRSTKESVPKYLVPQDFVLDLKKIDFESEHMKKMLNFVLRAFKGDPTKVYSVGFNVKLFNGSETTELTDEQMKEFLTPEEIEYIELYPELKEKFLKKKQLINSERVSIVQLLSPSEYMPIKELQEDITVDQLELYKTLAKAKSDAAEEKRKEDIKKVEETSGIRADEFDDIFG